MAPRRKIVPIPADLPWVARAVAIRGGNYREIEWIDLQILREVAGRLKHSLDSVRTVESELVRTGQDKIQVVGVRALLDAITSLERQVGLIGDCISQFEVQQTAAEGSEE